MSGVTSGSGAHENEHRENTSERFLSTLLDVHQCIDCVDRAIGLERFRRFAEVLRALDLHADPEKTGFNQHVGESRDRAFVWLQLAFCGTELQTAWNTLRLVNLGAARRCVRVALEYFSTAVAAGMPISIVRSQWPRLPRNKIPVWRMSLPRHYDKPENPGEPLIAGATFPHILMAIIRLFPEWSEEKVADLQRYLNTNLHPFAHGSAQGGAYFLSMTSERLPVVGAVFDPDHPELYVSLAEEIIDLGGQFDQILNSACRYLQSRQERPSG